MQHICYFCEWRISGPELHLLFSWASTVTPCSQWPVYWAEENFPVVIHSRTCPLVSSLHFCPRPSNSHLANCIIRKWLWYIEPSLKFERGRATIGQSSFGQGSGDIRPVDWIFPGHPPQWTFSETWWQADPANWEGRELRLCSCSLSLMILTQLLGRG